ncbi:MAG: DUF2797 domain-containing protein [Deltaproteobacteria bacterium]|nr:DUF2797 domain-containing protein [Deltaproteobacteria bacterium]MBW2665074.1 DUF2797 domain-containing protein [Deltaproteobacteria bacterium]
MKSALEVPVQYSLPIGVESFPLNERVGRTLALRFDGEIRCIHCDRSIKKSYQQGYCYPCFQRLACCDMCIVKPELCHYAKGTCREPAWGERHCLIPHSVYLANTSGLKVGVTRGVDPTTRWIDQGAAEALVVRRMKDRLEAGRLEVLLAEFVADKTNWRRMLKGPPVSLALADERDRLFATLEAKLAGEPIPGESPPDAEPVSLEYPVDEYPSKVVSHNLDKEPLLEGTLMGVKGQYLIFDTAVINVRKYGGYCLTVE